MGMTFGKERQYFWVTQQVQRAKREPPNLSVSDLERGNLRPMTRSSCENSVTSS